MEAGLSFDAWGESWGSPSAWGDSWVSESVEVSVIAPVIGGGYGPYRGPKRRTEEEIEQDRERYGLFSAIKIIEAVAARQAESLQRDEQKRLEELTRELALQRIEWRGEYLEQLNKKREALITAEISRLIRQRMLDEENMVILMLLAANA